MTFTLLTVELRYGLLGAVVASRSLAVGNAVIAVDPAIGIVASQAWTNRELRARMLEALTGGGRPEQVVAGIGAWDDRAELRQVAAMLPSGEVAIHTGEQNTPWAGGWSRPGLAVLGNLLTGPQVLDATVQAFEAAPLADGLEPEHAVADLGRRMVAAMVAGEAAGGDRRGRQSSAMIVTRRRHERRWPAELDLDLRVDDSRDPLGELARLIDLQVRQFVEPWPGAPSAFERADGT